MTPKVEQFLTTLQEWAESIDDIRFLMVLGSQARVDEPADEFSDGDLVISSTNHQRYLDNPDWISNLGRPLLTFLEPTATGGEYERRVLFESGLDVDFTLISHAKFAGMVANGLPADIIGVVSRGRRIVVDKDGLTTALERQVASRPPARKVPSETEFVEAVHDFLYHCLWAARKAARGELFTALQCLDCYLRRKLFELVHLHLHLTRGDDGGRWYGARMIERLADADVIEKLAAARATHDRRSILEGVDAAMALYASLAETVANHVGATYPKEAETRVREMIAAT